MTCRSALRNRFPTASWKRATPKLWRLITRGSRNYAAHGLPIFAEVDARNYGLTPEEKRDYYLSRLAELKPGVTEFLIHCAYGPPGPLHAPNADRREADTRVFTSEEMAVAIRSAGVRTINWKTFRQLNARDKK